MSRLVFPSPMLADMRAAMLREEAETCAIVFGVQCLWNGELLRIIARNFVLAPNDAYLERSPVRACLSPKFVASVVKDARAEGLSVTFVHTHPFELNEFSPVDDAGEVDLKKFLERRIPGVAHAALVLTPSASLARLLGTTTSLSVMEVGGEIALSGSGAEISKVYDRQIRAFGAAGQQRLASLKVAIVGLGGTGSLVAQQLAHLGVRRFLLIDPDHLEETNLNRVVGATSAKVGTAKVEVAKAMILQINPAATVEAHEQNVLGTPTAHLVPSADVAFCCTDSHGTRSVLNQIAYQYLVPTIDVGVVIDAPEGWIQRIAGRVQMLSPGLGCLVCNEILDPEKVRRDMLSEDERRRDPYIVGGVERQPAVVSLNSTVSSLGVTMLLNAAVGVPGTARFLNYNAIAGTVRQVRAACAPNCIICSREGLFARGDSSPLFTRDDW